MPRMINHSLSNAATQTPITHTPPGKYWNMYDAAVITAPCMLGAKHNNPPPFISNLQNSLANGTVNRTYVHPYAVTEQEARESIALTYAMISMVDDGLGRILQKIDQLGLKENTIIVYTSDHGDIMGDHGIMLTQGLHSAGVIRVPFIWSDPSFNQDARSDILASAIDFAPSVLNRAGLAPYSGIQGEDIVSAAKREKPPQRKGLIIEADELPENVNIENFFRVRTYVNDRWRLTLWVDNDFGELYDRENDPLELNNLWNDPSAKEDKASLVEAMLKQQYTYSDLMPRPDFMG